MIDCEISRLVLCGKIGGLWALIEEGLTGEQKILCVICCWPITQQPFDLGLKLCEIGLNKYAMRAAEAKQVADELIL